jgi:hypothetical protein
MDQEVPLGVDECAHDMSVQRCFRRVYMRKRQWLLDALARQPFPQWHQTIRTDVPWSSIGGCPPPAVSRQATAHRSWPKVTVRPWHVDGYVFARQRQNAPASFDQNRPGKWMLFPRCGQAVTAWRIVAQAGHAGHIWLAKISPRATRGRHLICIYTPDFTDRADVETVVQRLDNLGLVERVVYYKPDIFTYAGIYNRTRSSNRASVYEYLPSEHRMVATSSLSHACELLARAR